MLFCVNPFDVAPLSHAWSIAPLLQVCSIACLVFLGSLHLPSARETTGPARKTTMMNQALRLARSTRDARCASTLSGPTRLAHAACAAAIFLAGCGGEAADPGNSGFFVPQASGTTTGTDPAATDGSATADGDQTTGTSDTVGTPTGTDGSTTATDPNATAAPGGVTAPATAAVGLPCEVTDVLVGQCLVCHNGSLPGVVTMLSLDDLLADSIYTPGQTVAQTAVDRMLDGTMPPPPLPGVDPAAIQGFSDWVNAGSPAGSCGGTVGDPGDPTTGGIPTDPVPNPFATPSVCTSNTYWTFGDRESPLMYPGRACIECHGAGGGGEEEAPTFSIAGTVYPTAHEPDDCYGVDSSANGVVVITGADGQSFSLAVNDTGNFFREGGVALPYQARLETPTGVRIMVTPQTVGDCNSCHNEQGINSAPGRILLP